MPLATLFRVKVTRSSVVRSSETDTRNAHSKYEHNVMYRPNVIGKVSLWIDLHTDQQT